MKKMLFITPRIPIPAISGGLVGTLTSLKFLAKTYDMDFITLVEPNSVDIDTTKQKLEELGVKKMIFINHKLRNRSIKNIVSSILYNLPLTVYRHCSSEMKKKIKEIIDNYDYIYVDHWLMAQYIPNSYKGCVILKEHNAEYIMWERCAEIEKNLIKKMYILLETERIKVYEKNICNFASRVITVTDNDKANLMKIGADKGNITMLPAVIINNTKLPCNDFEKKENSLMYVGTLFWEANIDGLKYFFENIYPKVKAKIPDIKFYLIGKNPPAILQRFAEKDNSIILTGFVEDLTEYYNKSKLFVVYLRYGSGIKIKVLEALSNAMPVITTDVGMEGISTKGAVLANEDNDFADKIVDLMYNSEELKYMSIEGIKYISENYSQKIYIEYFKSIG